MNKKTIFRIEIIRLFNKVFKTRHSFKDFKRYVRLYNRFYFSDFGVNPPTWFFCYFRWSKHTEIGRKNALDYLERIREIIQRNLNND